MKITLHHQQGAFYPYDQESVDYTKKLTENGQYVVEIKRQRNPSYHRRAFACLNEMFNMIETELSFEEFRRLLVIKAGYYTTIGKVDLNGNTCVAVQAESLAFENMDEDTFQECFQNILQAFCDKFGKTLTLSQLDQWAMM